MLKPTVSKEGPSKNYLILGDFYPHTSMYIFHHCTESNDTDDIHNSPIN